MKVLYYLNLLIVILLLTNTNANAQITIGSENMPSQGDTIRVSQLTSAFLNDPSITGFNTTWDYSSLDPASQTVLNYINPINTPGIYQIIFNPFITNLASPINNLDFLEILDVQVTDAYTFYKNSSNEYTRVGYAANIMGLPVPMKYSQAERLYKFPLTENSAPDSSTSQITVQYPNVVYFNLLRKRVNTVDGSGVLQTPYGSFNTLRLKSVIYERDSVYIDSLSMGLPVIRNIIEYKWLSPDYPVPVLTITQEGTMFSVQYIDSIRNIVPLTVSLGGDQSICKGESVTLNAVVAGGTPPYTYLWNSGDTTQSITVSPEETTDYTILVIDSKGVPVTAGVSLTVIPFNTTSLGNDTTLCGEHNLTFNIEGNYDDITWFVNNIEKGNGPSFTIDSTGIGLNTAVIKISFQSGECTGVDEMNITFHICDALPEGQKVNLALSPNPVDQLLTISNIEFPFDTPQIKITNIAGAIVNLTDYVIDHGRIVLNTGKLNPGIYFISITEKDKISTGKFIKL